MLAWVLNLGFAASVAEAAVIDVTGLEFAPDERRLHYEPDRRRLHYEPDKRRLHYTPDNDR